MTWPYRHSTPSPNKRSAALRKVSTFKRPSFSRAARSRSTLRSSTCSPNASTSTADQAIVPDHPETMVARGAALALSGIFADTPADINPLAAAKRLANFTSADTDHAPGQPFFESEEARRQFEQRYQLPAESHGPHSAAARSHTRNGVLRAWLGIDSGSTTTKLALVADDGTLIDNFYANNEGDPLEVARRALVDLRNSYAAAGITFDIAGVGTTGYGELLLARALHADFHTVETVAHAHAATRFDPRCHVHPRHRRPGHEGHLA